VVTTRARSVVAQLVLALVAGAVTLVGAPASAHTDFLGADPRDGSTLRDLPREVRLEFSDDMDPNLSTATIQVGDGDARQLALSNGDRANVLAATLPESLADSLTPGTTTRWTLSFRVVSRDGHPVAGSTAFTVRSSGSETTSPSSAPSASPTASSVPDPPSSEASEEEAADAPEAVATDSRKGWLVAVAVGVLVLLVLAVATVMRLVGRDSEA
jgi:methionine-rich copper-binding protein CopC